MRRGWVAATRVAMLAVVAGAGCGGSKFDGTLIQLAIFPSIPPSPMNHFTVVMYDQSGDCPLSPQAKLAINGTTYPFGSCTGASDPFQGNPSFVLQAADGDDKAEMSVAGLIPGIDANIESPAGGQVAPGGSVSVSIPAAFQGQQPQIAEFSNTNQLDTYAGMITYPTVSDSQSVTFPAPQYPASYVFWVQLSPPLGSSTTSISADVLACSGFAHCYAEALDVLGPMMIAVTP